MTARFLFAAIACGASLVARAGADPTAGTLGNESTGPSTPLHEVTLQEIIVTADKVAEPLNRVPASIGVLTAAQLDQQNVVDMQDVVNRIPGLASDSGGAPGNGLFVIRGVTGGSGLTAATGMYIDDVSINMGSGGGAQSEFAGAYEPSLFDLDRIEVLRGPQGTLYGADSFGGTIRYVTRQPQLDSFSGDATATLYSQHSGGPGGSIRAALNAPLIDQTMALRVAGIYAYDGGFIDHVDAAGNVVRENTNTQEVYGVRASLLWQPSENLKVTPQIQYQVTSNADTWFYDTALGEYNTPRALEEPLRDEFLLAALNLDWSFGSNTLTSVSSYIDRSLRRTADYTVYDMGFLGPYIAAQFDPTDAKGSLEALTGVLTYAFHQDTNRQWAQELRLASHFDEVGISTLLGFYFNRTEQGQRSQEDAAQLQNETERLFGVTANEALAQTFGVPPDAPYLLGNILFSQDGETIITTKAAYLEASWSPSADFARGLKLTAGARVSRISYSTAVAQDGLFNGASSQTALSFSEDQVAPIYRITYQANDSTLFYASAGKGYQIGGANPPLPSTCDDEVKTSGIVPPASVPTDDLWSYELGSKLTLLNRSMQVNASVFHIDWNNISETVVLPVCGFGFADNVGSAKIDGGDLSIQVQPATGLDIALGVAYTNARFAKTVDLPGVSGVQEGAPIPFSPPWTAYANAAYSWTLSGGHPYVRADYNYTDVSRGSIVVAYGNFVRPAYGTVGASAGYTKGSWDVSLYGKNLTNAHPQLEQSIIIGYNNVSTLRPRVVGLSAHYSF
jgi:outer membrane receptor protein involved in Fe transport